ncbi:Na+-transporting methylmalonyl-CoA/oxaloacetate decarboxylase gamma subunit [Conyzicola nivalis]|uniref:Na+-transporting methylmalonyl-CoA/oxaloacetate decarboxylase gamma subunit n=1 Tax=Conyzicola nivalis TaxID=1477021 RepID=A0ABV2QQC4_9MICO
MNDVDWNTLVTRSGTRPPQPAADGDALRSVQRVLPRLSGTSLDADISLALLTAASSGKLRERLTETQGRSAQGMAAVKTAKRAGTSDPVLSPASIVLALAGVILLAIGTILSLRSIRTDNDYFVEDLQTAAISSGAVLLIVALWFAGTELIRNPWAGSRAGGWGWAFYLVPIAATCAAIVSIVFRIGDQSVHGAVGVGLTLQFVALAVFVVALVGALRNREEAAALKSEAAKTAPDKHLAKHNTQMRKETAWAVSKAAPGELDRDAAAAGLRQLYEQGRLPAERTEAILRTLG